MKTLFITSSGTEIGKTFISCNLIRKLIDEGKSVLPLKPIISGWDNNDQENDTIKLLQAANMEITEDNINMVSPWRFTAPLSPDMAAGKEGKSILLDDVVSFCKQERGQDILLIEGVGGVMVPLNNEHMVIDWIEKLSCEVILVVGSYLGAISHTLTAYHALKSRNITIKEVVISETPESTVDLLDTKKTLANFISEEIVVMPCVF